MYSELRTEVLYCALRQPSDFRGALRGLRARAVASLTFGVPIRSLLALLYGLSPSVDIIVDPDGQRFKIATQRSQWIPLSRHIAHVPHVSMTEAAADRAFRVHAKSFHLSCSLYELALDSSELCSIAGVGSRVVRAIALADEKVPYQAVQSAADRLDFALLLLIGGSALDPWHGPIYEALLAIQATGESAPSRVHWLSTLMGLIGWTVDPSELVEVLDNILPLQAKPSMEQRLAARSRIAVALAHA